MLLKHNKIGLLSLGLLSILTFSSRANIISHPHIIVAPQCLLNISKVKYETLAQVNTFSLIRMSHSSLERLIAEKKYSQASCGGFRDVTRAWTEINPTINHSQLFLSTYVLHMNPLKMPISYPIKSENEVNQLFLELNPQAMWSHLSEFTRFEDRSAKTLTGVAASSWIETEIKNIAQTNLRRDVTVYTIESGKRYKQRSVIAKMGTSNEPGIVIGAHMDTLSAKTYTSKYAIKPGADDDGTGTVTVLEVARVLLASDIQFSKPIYFIWYAAEEQGLVGSDYVVADFKKNNIPVSAVMQLDMTGFRYQNDPTMWLISDYVDPNLTAYLERLIATYIKQPVKFTRCGYACSDHATWTQNGYPAVMPSEASFRNSSPDIHTSEDTMEKLSLDHVTNYAKLAIAFAAELAK